jgi:hypothetical protein
VNIGSVVAGSKKKITISEEASCIVLTFLFRIKILLNSNTR